MLQKVVVQADQWSLDGSIKTEIEPLSDNATLHDMLTDGDDIAEHDACYLSEQHSHLALKPHHCLEHGAQPGADRDYASFDSTSSSVKSTGVRLSVCHKTRQPLFDGYIQTGVPVDDKQTSISDKPSAISHEVVDFEGAEYDKIFPGSNTLTTLQILEDDDLELDASYGSREDSSEDPDVVHLTQLPTHAQQAVPHVTNGRLQEMNSKLQNAVHRLSSPATQPPGDVWGQFGSSVLNGDGYIRTDQFFTGAVVTTDFNEEMHCDIDDFGYIFQTS